MNLFRCTLLTVNDPWPLKLCEVELRYVGTYFWRRFVVVNATSDNIVNTTSQICSQSDQRNVITKFFHRCINVYNSIPQIKRSESLHGTATIVTAKTWGLQLWPCCFVLRNFFEIFVLLKNINKYCFQGPIPNSGEPKFTLRNVNF